MHVEAAVRLLGEPDVQKDRKNGQIVLRGRLGINGYAVPRLCAARRAAVPGNLCHLGVVAVDNGRQVAL